MGRVTIGDYKLGIIHFSVRHTSHSSDGRPAPRIVSILSAYDDLIENNTRRIAILEEMARRLYEEWFVHFRFPGHEEVGFEESELGAKFRGLGGPGAW